MKYNKIALIYLYIIFTLTSCHSEYDGFTDANDYIQFDASSTDLTSRGTPLPQETRIQSIGVFGYYTGDGDDISQKWNDKRKPEFINNLEVTSDKNYKWTPKKNYTWPKKTAANVSFFAYSPFNNPKSGITVIAKDVVGIPKINYTVPTTCEDQPDLLVSELKKDLNLKRDNFYSVRFLMHHALTSIGFKGTGVGLIDKLTVTGVKTSGTLTTDESGKATWGNLSGNSPLNVKTNTGVGLTNQSADLNTEDGYLMMIPQVLLPGAKLTVTLVGGKTIDFPLRGEWTAGNKIFYEINLFDLKLTNTKPQFDTYIGAFWKSNQIGERIISVPFNTIPNAKTNGVWKAYVIFKDSRWAENDICFSSTPSKDPNLFSENTVDMNTRDGDFTVSDGAPSIVGTMNSTSPIYFRIGLRSRYTPTDANPARYAVVALVYQQNDKFNYHFIYLRQGGNPDFIMRKKESDNKDSDTPTRVNARKFAAYNLTTNLGGYSSFQCNFEGASFTNYPSQVGCYFTWANKDYQRYAISPRGDVGWSIKIPDSFWGYISSVYRVEPKSFRRPKDGSITKNVINDPSNSYVTNYENFNIDQQVNKNDSEFAQSLMATLKTASTNFAYGYYADGFFDRRAIQDNVSVADNTENRAYIGVLYYNPKTYASVFFPTSGYREGLYGTITEVGISSRYLSSGGYLQGGMHRGLCMNMSAIGGLFHLPFRSAAGNIRCVVGDEQYYKPSSSSFNWGGDDDDDEYDD